MKKKGMSVKKRVLILTSNARLIYFTPKAEYKGSVPWSMLKPLTVVKVNFLRIILYEDFNERAHLG